MSLRSSLKTFSIISVVLLALVAFAGQALAAQPQASSALYACQATPKVQAPPSLLKQSSQQVQQSASVCGANAVPQPISRSAFKQLPVVQKNASASPLVASGYLYASGYQYATGIGAIGYYTQHAPYLDTRDYHSLAELAGQSTDGKQIVEIGWTVDRGVNNGDTNPHLFVFSWVNRVPNCYNGCGYVQYSSTVYPGMRVAVTNTPQEYAVEYYQGNWWLWYQNQWIGYFPGSIWTSKGVTFNNLGLTQWFGEVAANGGSHTQMGNGLFGTSNGSAVINRMQRITSLSTSVSASASTSVTNASCYNIGHFASSSFTYGGPGC